MTRGFHFSWFGFLICTGLVAAAEPVAQTPVIIRQALLPPSPAVACPAALPQVPCISVASPIEMLPAPDKSLNADQLDGLRKAVQILEAADRQEAAAELRFTIMELELEQLKQVLAEKTKALAVLRAEANVLPAPCNATQIMLSFQVLEFSRTKLRDLGFDFDDDFALLNNKQGQAHPIVADSTTVEGLIKALSRNNIMKMVAEPTLVTMSGRPAYFHSGGEVPGPSEPDAAATIREFGTFIDAAPFIQADGSLKLEVRMRLVDVDQSLGLAVGNQTLPGFRTKQVDTGAVLRSGQTLVLCGLPQKRVEAFTGPDNQTEEVVNEIETLFLVRPTYQLPENESAR